MMARFRGRGNKATELSLLTILRERSIRGWHRHVRIRLKFDLSLKGKSRLSVKEHGRCPVCCRPDFVFALEKVVIFVDGCFWHRCPRHHRCPVTNKSYWKEKIARNVERDRLVRVALRRSGWRVLQIWEHELPFGDKVITKIERFLRS